MVNPRDLAGKRRRRNDSTKLCPCGFEPILSSYIQLPEQTAKLECLHSFQNKNIQENLNSDSHTYNHKKTRQNMHDRLNIIVNY